jgi:hypothetical protein
MVTQIQAIYRVESTDIAERFRQNAARLRARVGEMLADAIVDGSPVDTGTYVMAHRAGTGPSESDADRSSADKVRGRSPSQFKNLARGNLKRSVSAAAIQASGDIWITNSSLHAERVESLGWPAPLFGNPSISGPGPYRVYASARAQFPAFVSRAAAELGVQTR